MAFSSGNDFNDSDFLGSSSSKDGDMDTDMHILFACALAAQNSLHLFNANEWIEGPHQNVNPNVGVRDVLQNLRIMPIVFKMLTNFTVLEFDEVLQRVEPIILAHARSTGEQKILPSHPCKLTLAQRILNFLLYLKHDNTNFYDSFAWDWSPSALCADAIFISSCVNEAIHDKIQWPNADERLQLGQGLPQFLSCIGTLDGTLAKIRRPWRNRQHKHQFNGWKKIYCMNNIVFVDHHGLFMHIESGFPESAHDVNTLRQTRFHKDWRLNFTHYDDYFEYVLGDPSYQGVDHYIMRRLRSQEIPPDADLPAVRAYNKMHAGYRVCVEWGIGGLKLKWRRLAKVFDCTKPKFPHLFQLAALLTNFLHCCRMDFTEEVFGNQDEDAHDNGHWDGDDFGRI